MSPSDCLLLGLLSSDEQNNSYNNENRNVSYNFIEDTTWCVLLLGEMVYYVSYIVFNNLLHLMCNDRFACHIFYPELPCPPEKEIMNKVSTRSILCYLWETMKTHFKFLLSIPDIFLNFVSFLKWLNWSFEWRCTFIHAWLHIPTYIQQYVHLTCSLN